MKSVNQGQNQYCGPAALSILTGQSTDECASVLSSICNRYPIVAVSAPELLKSLERMRFEVQHKENACGCSMFSAFHTIVNEDGMYVVIVPKHVVVVEVANKQVYLCDNHTKEPINGAASARLSQRVVECLKVTKKADPVLLREVPRVNITQYNSFVNIEVNIVSEYENLEDNHMRRCGNIQVQNYLELRNILMTIDEKIGMRA